jgi:hypothetical protein
MSRRAILVVALLTVLAMTGGVAGGILVGQTDVGRQEASRNTTLATMQVAPVPDPTVVETTVPPTSLPATTAALATGATTARTAPPTPVVPGPAPAPTPLASAPTTTGPPRLTARVAQRLADGIVIRLDASQPLTQAVLRFGVDGRLDQTRSILGTIRHGTITLPLPDDRIVTIQVSGRTASGVVVRSNIIKGQRLTS